MNILPSLAYWPVACDLSTLTLGHITVGRETQIACDATAEHAKSLEISEYTILPAAGISPDQNYAEQPMCEIMCSYLREQGVLVENLTPLIGSTFNTQGEAQAVALYIKKKSKH